MQKEKTSNLPLMVALMAVLLGTMQVAHAEDATVQATVQADASAASMDQSSTLGDIIKRAKQVGEREFVAKLNPARKNADRNVAADPVVEKNPVLLALYGTDLNYKAELDVNGQSRVVPVPGPLQRMGQWKYIALMEEGVLLTKSPQEGAAAAGARTGETRGSSKLGAAVLACRQKETCLFLSLSKGGDDSRSLAPPDAQARLLANQLPGGRAPALEFGGKPQPAGDRINMHNTAPASR
ncbi:MAG: hypothetical protein GAK35_03890 [Herbaspirillum frisingense]|uniref:Type IV pilus biogenesis protein PilP n=1 Tax=Herbaspirillum frisingense TaxID=92645 RepID=A0A7V8FTG5_9BURK|nr:MAG: hypothetical protein GAK35_03890 [Herbaspirillum frisingense]